MAAMGVGGGVNGGEGQKVEETPQPTREQLAGLERLVQMVMRAFYKPECIVVVDELVRHRCRVKDEVLAKLLNLPKRQILQTLHFLKGDRVVDFEMRNERNERIFEPEPAAEETMGKKRYRSSTNHTLWHVDYKMFLDVVSYRVQKLQEEFAPERRAAEQYDFVCDTCRRRHDDITASHLMFFCEKCGQELREEKRVIPESEAAAAQFLAPIVDQLRLVSSFPLPRFDRDVTEVEESEDGRLLAKYKSRTASAAGHSSTSTRLAAGEMGINVIVDRDHPAALVVTAEAALAASEGDTSLISWLTKPVDAEATRRAILITRTARPVRGRTAASQNTPKHHRERLARLSHDYASYLHGYQ
mmetsp:Transcript_24337/g.68193  ORF Transcript_24337/g.68193 Transcript_24337/m.68193 type:complete len:358 (+) Transcript_24337:346-1419(+)|eukprot:CAMPEP_0119158048 /NCGR_PEP_ID=MMETSP1310-20130426/53063_1 /TAXON_ID=464262 /ORGANISM="Genus nov. species nov., Strain RCC2339" /LENGTH=357 /DNA_ID=CAMNT_0007150671 /DNA_START=27 /DNA_END=1100 /DNA_ORIENTATION=-